jgi:Cof subfamily protein (haloacid dehalogenase superfamily)
VTPAEIRSPGAPRPGFVVEAVALDLDGTCLDSRQRLHPRIRECVRRAAQRVPVVLATGRMYRSAQPWAAELGTQSPLVCYQGALVREHAPAGSLGRVLYACELAPGPALHALRVARENGWHVNAYQDEALLCEQDRREAHLYAQIAHVPITFVDDLEPLLQHGSTKVVCVIEDEAEVSRCMAAMTAQLERSARVTRSLPQFVEIVNAKASKAVASGVALGLMGVSLQRAVAIGDAPNDVEMLDASGFAVAVRTAPADVMHRADALCESPESGGVADALEVLGLC